MYPLDLALTILQTSRADFLAVVAQQKVDLDNWIAKQGGMDDLNPGQKQHVEIRMANLNKMLTYENNVADMVGCLVEMLEERDQKIRHLKTELEALDPFQRNPFDRNQIHADSHRNARLKWPELF